MNPLDPTVRGCGVAGLGSGGGTAVTKPLSPTTLTQTYSTAEATHANLTSAALTVADGTGTNDGTIGAITGDASVIAAVQEIVANQTALRNDLIDLKQFVNVIADILQAQGEAG